MKLTSLSGVTQHTAIGEPCSLHGRIKSVRRHGRVLFIDVWDHTGQAQVVVDKTTNPDLFHEVANMTEGSYVHAVGVMGRDRKGDPEVASTGIRVLAAATASVDPKPWKIDGTDPVHSKQVFEHTSMYVANPQRAAVFTAKANFVSAFHDYFRSNGFVLVEPPILTNRTLYHEKNAAHVRLHDEQVFLSQCATFELEPLALAFGKVYTISPAFRNEPGGSKKHLAEYTHAKAEVLLANLDDLIELASESVYRSVIEMAEKSQREISLLGAKMDLEALHPAKHERIRYDQAITLLQSLGSTTEYGRGLTHADERMLTTYMGDRYVWVQFPPRSIEGFPYKRKSDEPELAMVSDLIAPHGAGEMVGVAEKIVDPEELIQNLIEKGKVNELAQYWEYVALRRFGLPPHGGLGAAPERILYGLLGLDHIRLTKPWPRYPDRNIRVPAGPLETFGDPELERLVHTYNLGPQISAGSLTRRTYDKKDF